MSNESDNEPILTEEEIDALVEHADGVDQFDDGEFRTHDFGAGESVTLSKWRELDGLLRGHAEALEGVFQFAFDLDVAAEPFSPLYATNGDLLHTLPERLCLISVPVTPIQGECHLALPGSLLAFLVNEYFGGSAIEPPRLTGKVTPSEQRVGERLGKEFLRVMREIWADRIGLQFGDLYVDNTPEKLSLLPKELGFVVLTFMFTIGDRHRSEARFLIPFEGLEPLSTHLMPKQREEEDLSVVPIGSEACVPRFQIYPLKWPVF